MSIRANQHEEGKKKVYTSEDWESSWMIANQTKKSLRTGVNSAKPIPTTP